MVRRPSQRRQFPRVPASPIPPAYRRGIARERNQPLTPPCVQPPTTASVLPWRATQPPTHSPRHFVNNNIKKPLHNFPLSAIMKQETAKAYKAGREVLRVPHAPMQEKQPPTQQISAPSPFYQISIAYASTKNGNVCFSFRRCRGKNTLRRFCCLGGPEQSPRGTGRTHPQGPDR